MENSILNLSNSELLAWYNFTNDQCQFYTVAAKARRQNNDTLGAIEMEANAKDMMKKVSAFNAVLLIRLKDIKLINLEDGA